MSASSFLEVRAPGASPEGPPQRARPPPSPSERTEQLFCLLEHLQRIRLPVAGRRTHFLGRSESHTLRAWTKFTVGTGSRWRTRPRSVGRPVL